MYLNPLAPTVELDRRKQSDREGKGDPMSTADYDVAIGGGSIGGCTAAALVGRTGRSVAPLENQVDRGACEKVCPIFIRPSAVPTIQQLGLDREKGGRTIRPRSIAMPSRILITVVALVAALGGLAPPSEAAKGLGTSSVVGNWTQLVNCAITSYNPLTKQATCVGSSMWTGTWTGLTHYVFQGTLDLITGDAQGTLSETFSGTSSSGGTGTLQFQESLTLVGATSTLHIDATLTSGTGDFSGARGSVAFDGTDNLATGFGTYAGWWQLPGPGA